MEYFLEFLFWQPRSYRLLWLTYFVASTGGVYYAGQTQWFRYTVNPTVISLERDFRSWNGTLPAMTLCYFSKVDPEKAEAFIQRYEGLLGL